MALQLTKLVIQGKTYVATTQEGECTIKHQPLSKFFCGKVGQPLCTAVNTVLRTVNIVLDDVTHEVVDAHDLIVTLRNSARIAKLTKPMTCSCGAVWLKGDRVLLENKAQIVVGCDACTEGAIGQAERPDASAEVAHPYRVEIVGAYPDCLENIHATRNVFRRRYEPSAFRIGVQPGVCLGELVYVRYIDGVLGATSVNNYPALLGLLKNLNFGSYREDSTSGEWVWHETAPPAGIVTHMLAHPDDQVPVLHSLARLPILTKDGEIINTPGYDVASRVYLAPTFTLEEVPEIVTAEHVAEAKQILDHLLTDFPFATPAAKSATIGCLVDQCVRASLIKGPTPAYCFEAPVGGEGTGKSLLSEVVAKLADGAEIAKPVWSTKDEELTKQLLPLIESQKTVLLFDNVDGHIASSVLDSLLTSRVFQTRRLGRNSAKDMVRVPFSSSILFSSNGAHFNNSLARRMVTIHLDQTLRKTQVDHRDRRKYAIENISHYAEQPENRARILRAVYVIAKAWIQADRPEDPDLKMLHSFEEWCQIVPAIVRFGGWASMNDAIHAAATTGNTNYQDSQNFGRYWWSAAGTSVISIEQLGRLAHGGGFFPGTLKTSAKQVNFAVLGRAVHAKHRGFLQRWAIEVEPNVIAYVMDGPPDAQGQPTLYLRVRGKEDAPLTWAVTADGSDANAGGGFDPEAEYQLT